MVKMIKDFLQLESIGGILLIIATIIAIITANYATGIYDYFINMNITLTFNEFGIDKPLLLWVNDGLMAIFFFIVGLEIKRELLDGELSQPQNVILPIVAAVGGMVVPAAIYALFNYSDDIAIRGWAIPSATDIAFALGVLLLLGNRVPHSLKVFLVTLAIADDLGAIIIIALFYTAEINTMALGFSVVATFILFILNRAKVYIIAPYIIVGIILWFAMLKSGVHATLAGVITALLIPYMPAKNTNKNMIEELEHKLHPVVTYFILPLFAFVNTGISFAVVSLENLSHNISLGIILGLFIGKQIGIFGLAVLVIKTGLAKMPTNSNYLQIYGVSVLCGIGFTMSLFIGKLSFTGANIVAIDERFSILVGSFISAVYGYLILLLASNTKHIGNLKS